MSEYQECKVSDEGVCSITLPPKPSSVVGVMVSTRFPRHDNEEVSIFCPSLIFSDPVGLLYVDSTMENVEIVVPRAVAIDVDENKL